MWDKIKQVSKTRRGSITYRAVLIGDKWIIEYVLSGDIIHVPIDTKSVSFKHAKAIYSTAANDEKDLYTKVDRALPYVGKHEDLVIDLWFIFKDRLIVPGRIDKGKFVISNKFYLDGYEYGVKGEVLEDCKYIKR